MPTILITGASTGIGRDTALLFQQKGWQVIATMRHPEKRETPLRGLERVELMHLDVTDTASVREAIRKTLDKHQTLDALLNNAGYSLSGLFENAPAEQVLKQYQTNVLGLMDVTREILPVFRNQKHGILINVASIGGRVAFPLYSLYNSTKWAVEGFSEALHFELRPLNIKVKLIEPGIIQTDFYERSMMIPEQTLAGAYGSFAQKVLDKMHRPTLRGSSPQGIARLIYRAATDGSWKLRYASGRYAKLILGLRRVLPDGIFHALLKKAMQ